MERENFITIQGFMVKDLKLKGTELLIYALIYGFSQDNSSYYSNSYNYIAEWVGISKRQVINILSKLIKIDLICKVSSNDGQEKNKYKVTKKRTLVTDEKPSTTGVIDFTPTSEKISPQPVQKFHHPSEKISPVILINKNNNKNINKFSSGSSREKKQKQLKEFLNLYPAIKNLGYLKTEKEFLKKDYTEEEFNLLLASLKNIPLNYQAENFRYMPTSPNFFKKNYDVVFINELKNSFLLDSQNVEDASNVEITENDFIF